jgi:hypothetical protein
MLPSCIIIGMSWASVSPTVLPLAGVVIGACGTLLGQHLAMRVDARREAARQASDQRTERKEAVIGFLSATERVEQHQGQLAEEPSHDTAALIELMHAVWLAKKIIELVCSGALAEAAQDYTLELNRASQELRPPGTSRRPPGSSAREAKHGQDLLQARWESRAGECAHQTGRQGATAARRTAPPTVTTTVAAAYLNQLVSDLRPG